MPPKKGKKKDDKKDEKKEQEKEPERPDGPKSWVVGGWSGISRVSEVMEKVNEGDLVIINKGTYDEQLTVTKKTSIMGAGDEDTRPVLAAGMVTTVDCSVSSLVVKSQCTVEKGDAKFSQCHFEDADNLLTLYPHCSPAVADCTFTNARKSCVYCFPHSKGLVTKCTFSGDGAAETATCAVTMDNSATTVKDNTIKGTATGVYAFCAVPVSEPRLLEKPVIQNNTISGCVGTAFHLDKGATCQFSGNQIQGSGYWGVTVSGGATGAFSKNKINDKVRIKEGCRPLLSRMCPRQD